MASQGSVIARVYTSDAYLPLRDVPVVFSRTEADGTTTLLAVRMTDQSGLTAPVFVETPDASESLTPNGSVRPFTAINILVEYPGYRQVLAEGVQIFPEVETIQGLQLRPSSSVYFPDSGPTLIFEPPQEL